MTAAVSEVQWTAVDGWTTTHAIRPYSVPRRTWCGRRIGARTLHPASATTRCGRCTTHTTGDTR